MRFLRLSIVGSIQVDCSNGELDPMTNTFIQMSGVFAELELRIIRERVRSGMRNARAKGIAAPRCRWQEKWGRNYRSGRKTRGSA